MTPPRIFDRELLARRIARRAPEADFITPLVHADLDDRLAAVTRRFAAALVLGPDGRTLPESGRSGEGAFGFSRRATLVPTPDAPLFDPGLAEPLGGPYDLVVSLLDLQIIDDVPGFLARIRAALAPDGLFVAAALGGRSLTELRESWLMADAEASGGASPRVAPMLDIRDGGGLLQRAGFALPVADVEVHTVRYGSPLALMAEIKAMGASNPLAERSRVPVVPARLVRAAAHYADRFADPDGKVRATLEIVWLSGWAPHESQQKPLRPGSATVPLGKVLGSDPR